MRISDWSSDVCSSDLQQATATMIVTAEVCTIPLTTDEGATAIEGPDVGVCLACNVSHPERVVDPDNTQAGVINVGVGALNASRSIDALGRASCRERVCQYV